MPDSVKKENDLAAWDFHYDDTAISIASVYKTVFLGDQLVIGDQVETNDQKVTFQLNACVPSKVSLTSNRLLIYRFSNVGKITVDITERKVDSNLTTPASVIEGKIISNLYALFENVETVIRQQGSNAWGRMSFCQTFLNPFYEITLQLLNYDQILTINEIYESKREKYLAPLIKDEYAVLMEDGLILMPGNNLLALQEKLQDKLGEDYFDFEAAQLVVGSLIANQYEYIKNELRAYAVQPYIDMAKSYYLAALEAEELIPLTAEEIFQKFNTIGRSRKTYGIKNMRYFKILSEIVAGRILSFRRKERTYIGKEETFDKIFEFRDDILAERIEVPVL